MATSSLPATPKAATSLAPASEGTGTPGKWRHPMLAEIVRRQNAATFGEKNVKRLVSNGAVLIMTYALGGTAKAYSSKILDTGDAFRDFAMVICQLFLFANIIMALYPLFRPKDDLSDIPLTPTQRKLLGLDPSATPPATPGTTFATPPRYRLSTSRKPSPASRPSSPMSANASFSERRPSAGTPYSPVSSPLLYKAVSNGGLDSGRRQSFGSSSFGASSFGASSFGASSFGESSLGPSTPSPLAGKRASLGVKNKWLYERSRRLSASNGAL
ncbi:uncharacterized protein N7511_000520 [Penicillium nucicola]|uniref:uncharacterized protein n=1 Tax=Penicillium nucicola TaxID=1850975 RepID=UPI002545180B|nr:uncharacterized protein N7511_000520 [Penicillium nucicola]KAJ5775509.1 hypothetical protein N7511_000520 [Penicillium nucicola]